jgi:hypothetical protein
MASQKQMEAKFKVAQDTAVSSSSVREGHTLLQGIQPAAEGSDCVAAWGRTGAAERVAGERKQLRYAAALEPFCAAPRACHLRSELETASKGAPAVTPASVTAATSAATTTATHPSRNHQQPSATISSSTQASLLARRCCCCCCCCCCRMTGSSALSWRCRRARTTLRARR